MTGCAGRIATFVYWLGCAGAAVMLALAAFGLFGGGSGGERLWSSLFLVLGAGAAYGTGRVARRLVARSGAHGVRRP